MFEVFRREDSRRMFRRTWKSAGAKRGSLCGYIHSEIDEEDGGFAIFLGEEEGRMYLEYFCDSETAYVKASTDIKMTRAHSCYHITRF